MNTYIASAAYVLNHQVVTVSETLQANTPLEAVAQLCKLHNINKYLYADYYTVKNNSHENITH